MGHRMELKQAYRYCMEVTQHHYENFPVASRLIPEKLRGPISAIYAFARTADDFADELQDRDKLLDWRRQLYQAANGAANHPIFIALSHSIRTHKLPVQWLDDLLTAFLMDLEKNRFPNFKELHSYCHYSANPVGRIVLWLFGFREERIMIHSDQITTALQLTNFWQDISVDASKNRIYIPTKLLRSYRMTENHILKKEPHPNIEPLIEKLVNMTLNLYRKGAGIFHYVKGRLSWELNLTILGGVTTLEKVYAQRSRILIARPTLTKWDWTKIIFQNTLNFK